MDVCDPEPGLRVQNTEQRNLNLPNPREARVPAIMSNNYEWECALGRMISFLGCGQRDNGRHYPAHLPHYEHTSHANIFASLLPRLIDAVVGYLGFSFWASVNDNAGRRSWPRPLPNHTSS